MPRSTHRRLADAQEQVQIVADSVDENHPEAADLSFLASELERLESEV